MSKLIISNNKMRKEHVLLEDGNCLRLDGLVINNFTGVKLYVRKEAP